MNLPSELEELRDHGLPDGWHRYWHGSQDCLLGMLSEETWQERRNNLAQLSDAELLAEAAQAELEPCFYTGETLRNPEANNREYRGSAGITSGDEDYIYVGQTEWGPAGSVSRRSKIVYAGTDLQSAVDAVNSRLTAKRQKGYIGTGGDPGGSINKWGARGSFEQKICPELHR